MSLYGNNDRVHTAGIANLEEGLKKVIKEGLFELK